jgi:hypothetical protein
MGTSAFFLVLWFSFRYHLIILAQRIRWKTQNPNSELAGLPAQLNLYAVESFIKETDAMVLLIFLAASFLDLVEGFVWVKPCTLLSICLINKTAKSVMVAIFKFWDQILVTFFMTLMFFVLFTLVGMLFFYQNLTPGSGIDCSELLQCLSFTINLGMRYPMGFGNFLIISNDDIDPNYWWITLWQLGIFLIINLI